MMAVLSWDYRTLEEVSAYQRVMRGAEKCIRVDEGSRNIEDPHAPPRRPKADPAV